MAEPTLPVAAGGTLPSDDLSPSSRDDQFITLTLFATMSFRL